MRNLGTSGRGGVISRLQKLVPTRFRRRSTQNSSERSESDTNSRREHRKRPLRRSSSVHSSSSGEGESDRDGRRKIRFAENVVVFEIPARSDLDISLLWWSRRDFEVFKARFLQWLYGELQDDEDENPPCHALPAHYRGDSLEESLADSSPDSLMFCKHGRSQVVYWGAESESAFDWVPNAPAGTSCSTPISVYSRSEDGVVESCSDSSSSSSESDNDDDEEVSSDVETECRSHDFSSNSTDITVDGYLQHHTGTISVSSDTVCDDLDIEEEIDVDSPSVQHVHQHHHHHHHRSSHHKQRKDTSPTGEGRQRRDTPPLPLLRCDSSESIEHMTEDSNSLEELEIYDYPVKSWYEKVHSIASPCPTDRLTEYDSDGESSLSLNEFCQMDSPNPALRGRRALVS